MHKIDWKAKGKIVANGVLYSNPTFRLVLGMCPTLAVTTSAFNGLSMGLAFTVVLIFSNLAVSLLRRVIPDKVRIPAYVLLVAAFVSALQMVLQKFIPSLYAALGIYLPLIVVNCIILARAEAFASVNTVGDSVLDAVGMGLGFTLALTFLGVVREFIGAGTLFSGSIGNLSFGITLGDMPDYAMSVMVLPAGGFFTLGVVMAIFNSVLEKSETRRKVKLTELEKTAADIENAALSLYSEKPYASAAELRSDAAKDGFSDLPPRATADLRNGEDGQWNI
jgi:electron transport complex protein RnfE